MKPLIDDILLALEGAAPPALAEEWDNVGLLVGSRSAEVVSILIALDASNRVIDEAVATGVDTVITHHPVIFKPLSTIDTGEPTGRILQKALGHNINIIACHTNLDSASGGVNDILARELGLSSLSPLLRSEDGVDKETSGLGRVGHLSKPLSGECFMQHLLEVLDLNYVNVAGPLPQTVTTVALCGGSGSDLARLARSRGADIFLSAEIKHDVAVWANDAGFCIVDGTHYATEKPGTRRLAAVLEKAAEEHGWQTKITMTEAEGPPFAAVRKNMK